MSVLIGEKWIGEYEPTYIIGEIGINHNGDINIAKRLIDVASDAGCDAVKFQKRTPELCVPKEQRDVKRETPWGTMTYMEYRERTEFGKKEYQEIEDYCREKNIDWFASCWDEPSVDFIEEFFPVCYKVASASLTDDNLLKKIKGTKRSIILSTGMSTFEEIIHATDIIGWSYPVLLAHCTSAYPCMPKELNLRMIKTLSDYFKVPVGYSGHEIGLQATYAAVALGACFIERHITLDRDMWGSDQASSIEPEDLKRMVSDIRVIKQAMGDGIKKVYDSELPIKTKLRRI